MMESDLEGAAREAAARIPDARARHFYDPGQKSGKAIARALGHPGEVAWDMYLFYPSGAEWAAGPPQPIDYAHQLEDAAWADRSHLHVGDDLAETLGKIMENLDATQKGQ